MTSHAKFTRHKPRVLATTYMSPNLADKCREIGLQFIDTAGNAYLESGDLLIYVTGRRLDAAVRVAKSRGTSNPTTLRMIFAILTRPALLQASYREIAEASGVALGSVGSVFQDLTVRGWLVNAPVAQRRRLTAPDRLLDEWVANFRLFCARAYRLIDSRRLNPTGGAQRRPRVSSTPIGVARLRGRS